MSFIFAILYTVLAWLYASSQGVMAFNVGTIIFLVVVCLFAYSVAQSRKFWGCVVALILLVPIVAMLQIGSAIVGFGIEMIGIVIRALF